MVAPLRISGKTCADDILILEPSCDGVRVTAIGHARVSVFVPPEQIAAVARWWVERALTDAGVDRLLNAWHGVELSHPDEESEEVAELRRDMRAAMLAAFADSIAADVAKAEDAIVGTPAAETLWCVHVPGPDDLYAAPTREAAQKHADEMNAAFRRFYDANPRTKYDPEMVTAVVIPWPWSADAHAEDMRQQEERSNSIPEPLKAAEDAPGA